MNLEELKNDPAVMISFLRNITLFANLDDEILNYLTGQLQSAAAGSGEAVIREDESGDCLYIVVEGRLEAVKKGKVLGEIISGEIFGEMALISDEPRSATVRAKTGTELLRLSKVQFSRLLHAYPSKVKEIADTITRRHYSQSNIQYRPLSHDLISFLGKVKLFSSLPESYLVRMEPYMEWMFLPENEFLMRQGDDGDCLYVVMNGRLAYSRRDGQGRITAQGYLRSGDIVGEISVLTGEKRNATVQALRDCEIIRFSMFSLRNCMTRFPKVVFELSRMLALRQMRTEEHAPLNNIAVIPLTDGAARAGLAGRLHAAMGGRVLHVTADMVEASLGEGMSCLSTDDQRCGTLHFWLSEQEKSNDYLLLEGDAGNGAWTEHCIRQSDRILLVVDSESDASLSPIEMKYFGMVDTLHARSRELVILHPAGNVEIRNTDRLLENRNIPHHHVRIDEVADISRLARIITGKGIGIVLSGGGARGLAHIGVIKALHEHGIPIDMIGGTSFGALIAAACASGYNVDTIIRLVRDNIIRDNPLKEYTFPFIALIKGGKYARNLKKAYGNKLIEDCLIKYFAVSTNLTARKEYVFEQGPLWESVRGSSSLPGIAPPIFIKGQMLVDGGLLNNVPVDIMRKKGAGRVLAVDVSGGSTKGDDGEYGELVKDYQPGEIPSFLSLVVNKFRKGSRGRNFPGIGHIMVRSSLVNSVSKAQQSQQDADVYARLQVGEYSLMNFGLIHELIRVGYDYSCANIEEWKESLGMRQRE